jgi:hypothetical protein
MFLLCEVFNTSVDKSVENGGFSKANYIFLSSLNRFALFGCKNFFQQDSLQLAAKQTHISPEEILATPLEFNHLGVSSTNFTQHFTSNSLSTTSAAYRDES